MKQGASDKCRTIPMEKYMRFVHIKLIIGSTTQNLPKRFHEHKQSYQAYLKTQKKTFPAEKNFSCRKKKLFLSRRKIFQKGKEKTFFAVYHVMMAWARHRANARFKNGKSLVFNLSSVQICWNFNQIGPAWNFHSQRQNKL